ncbi:MAG: biotin--[acetyl-CoA-carboxylase] ligase [Synechococcaceae cyanobacterium]|nr:biotin--[acetyl-CoA-carboxylase] ligase [Synechococcaceae cyanobacterium]
MAERRRIGPLPGVSPLPWRLRSRSVCASTEWELDRWLAAAAASSSAPPLPLAVLAAQQRCGHGQQGRLWHSPPGGVWLSAALPWPQQAATAAAPALAVAVALVRELQPLLDRWGAARLAIKWPNDLMVCEGAPPPRKLAGLLPRLRLRGDRVRWVRVGVGLNGCNRVPAGAISLAQLAPGRGHGWLSPPRLAARVLRALEEAAARAVEAEAVRRDAEALLLRELPVWLEGEPWQPAGLALDGRLRLVCGDRERWLDRRF